MDKIVSFTIPNDCTHVVHNGMEYSLADVAAQVAGTPATEYELRTVNGEEQTWKREPGGEWEYCEPCNEKAPLDFGDIPDDDCEGCQ